MQEFLDKVRGQLGASAPRVTQAEIDAVLELARVAAHSSERRAAPITAYLVGMAVAGAAPEARAKFLDDLTLKLELQAGDDDAPTASEAQA